MGCLEELIQKCDLLYICVPLNDTTERMFNHENMPLLKGKFIVNVARAEVFDEELLYDSLRSCEILGYASDVWFCEPNKSDRMQRVAPSKFPYSELKNVVMSPHCATHTGNAQSRYISDCVNACILYIKQLPI